VDARPALFLQTNDERALTSLGSMTSLLDEIERAAVDSTVSLPDLLRKCKVLAARLKHREFADWVSHELGGYDPKDTLPPYRSVAAGHSVGTLVGSFGRQLKNAPLPLLSLPEDVRDALNTYSFYESVSTLERIAASDKPRIRVKWPPDLIALVANQYPMYEGVNLVDAWRPLTTATVAGILDTVGTRVLDFVLAIQAENPAAGEAAPNAPPPVPPQVVTQHFNTTIIGGQANLGNLGAASIGSGNVATGTASSGVSGDALAWLAVEGASPTMIRDVAGHTQTSMTDRYMRSAAILRGGRFGRPFPPLPRGLLTRVGQVWTRSKKEASDPARLVAGWTGLEHGSGRCGIEPFSRWIVRAAVGRRFRNVFTNALRGATQYQSGQRRFGTPLA
jgi:hypothetical protein